jgi:plasmid stability protein
MANHPVTINLPEPLYQRLQERAVEANRSLEAELLDVVAMAVPDELDPDLQETLHALALLDDADLWRAGRSHFHERPLQRWRICIISASAKD